MSAEQVEVRPPSPFRLPLRGSEDGTMRVRDGVVARLLTVEDRQVLVRAWQPGHRRVLLRAEAVADANPQQLREAIERMRFALGVDDDLGEFFRRFRRDPLLGPLLRRRAERRPPRRPWPWEAVAWAVVKQLIESDRAARIQRRIVGRWGPRLAADERLRDVPGAATIAARAPAELAALDLSPGRSVALRKVAAEVSSGRCDPAEAEGDRRLLAIPEIGPWTVQCLGFYGRGDNDSLPSGDLMYLKLVGRLAQLGRRATIPEVEEFFAPYAPFRGRAGSLLVGFG